MPDQEHLDILKQGVERWNQWRQEHPDIRPDLRGAILFRANLSKADLSQATLIGANFGLVLPQSQAKKP